MLSYIARRLIIVIPMLIAISLLSFFVITLPPGSFIDTYVAELKRQGGEAREDRIAAIEQRYGLNDPFHVQYFKWISGFVKGDLGISFKENKSVWSIIKERIGYTALISISTLLFTWFLAIPIGIFSAVKQYSPFDYVFTFLGFIGVSIPNFILALVIMYFGIVIFDMDLTGLISMQYMGEPWSISKFLDLLNHIWVPVIVVGTGGMAGLIRVMRGQMLDELRKVYVQTARAKGLSEFVVIVKHVARIAINPIISTVGWLLPAIISGDTIAGLVLGLPTLGPRLFEALQSQDMYLAGSIVLISSILVIIGTLISDILLALVDPRIRYR